MNKDSEVLEVFRKELGKLVAKSSAGLDQQVASVKAQLAKAPTDFLLAVQKVLAARCENSAHLDPIDQVILACAGYGFTSLMLSVGADKAEGVIPL